jgi:spermidine synthase
VKVFQETLHGGHGQILSIDEVLFTGHTGHQDVLIFTNPVFGKVLALDGVVQLTELDNCIYHEMVTHVPAMAHGSPGDVLIIGGGDGGTLKEVLKHPVESVVLIELDAEVISLSRKFFPEVSGGAFDDPRASIVIGDGAAWVEDTSKRFDLIVIDSTDPVGPGEALFSHRFYQRCRSLLRPGGIVSLQSGTAFYDVARLERQLETLRRCFGSARPFLAPVPTYAHGLLALIVAAQADIFCPPVELLHARFGRLGTAYYSPEMHHAAFVAAPLCFTRSSAPR